MSYQQASSTSFVASDRHSAHDSHLPQTAPNPPSQAGPDFPVGRENAQNGRKFTPPDPDGRSGAGAANSSQGVAPNDIELMRELEDRAWRAAALKEYSDIQARRAAEKSATAQEACADPLAAAPEVVAPTAEEIRIRRQRGRPTVIDEEMQLQIVTLLSAGVSLTQTAAHVGIARSTLQSALARDDSFAEEVHEARQRAQLYPLNCLLKAAARNWRAAAWLMSYLERKMQQERSPREQVYDAADALIQRDLAQELREDARLSRDEARQAPEQDEAPPGPRMRKPRSR